MNKPTIPAFPLSSLSGLDLRGFLVQDKSDGCHEFLAYAGNVFNAERMRGDSGVYWVVNDVISISGQNVAGEPTAARWAACGELLRDGTPNVRLSRVLTSAGDVERLIADGGEGCVIKYLSGCFGQGWAKFKRSENFICRVASLDYTKGSVELVDAATGQRRGKLPLRSRFDEVAGLMARGERFCLKIVAFGQHKSGLLREAKLDCDPANPSSWLVKV